MAGVWVASLDRFGYDLMVVEKSKEKAKAAMSAEYIKTYFKLNKAWGDMPYDSVEDLVANDEEFQEYYKTAMDEMYVRKLEYGVVEWG